MSSDKDLRVQKNNSHSKILLKKSMVCNSMCNSTKPEIEILAKKNDFDTLLEFLETLGHEVEVKLFRKRHIFNWDDITVCIDFTRGYGYILKLELVTSDQDKDIVIHKLREKLHFLGLEETPEHVFDEKFKYYKENWKDLV